MIVNIQTENAKQKNLTNGANEGNSFEFKNNFHEKFSLSCEKFRPRILHARCGVERNELWR